MPLDDTKLHCWTFAGWEPDRHYRRLGSRSTLMFGNGDWIGAWRRRVESRDTVSMLVDCGIDIVVTQFYKGFGIKVESAEWPRLKEFVALCHEQDVKVWGYLQGMSIYYETFLEEEPEVMDWVARRHDGSPDYWSSAYYRCAPCLTSEDYRAYVRKIIRIGLAEIGLDAIHNDNSYYKHCYCDRCARLFREWLNAMPDIEERMGLPNANHVLPPPLPTDQRDFVDPLQIAWMEFGAQKRLEAYRGFYETIKKISPDAFYETNPAFPKRGGFKSRLAFDPAREGRICDAVCCENGSLPRVESERIFSQVEAYLHADAGSYNVMHTSWIHGERETSPRRSVGGLWTGLAEEFSHHSAMLGNNWLLRPAGDGARILGDTDDLRQAHAQAVHFFRGLHERLELAGRRQWSQIALLIEPDTLTHAGSSDLPALRALLGWSLIQRVPLVMLYGGRPIPDFVRALFICQQTSLSDARLDEITRFAQQDRRNVFLAGTSGRYNERMVPRNESDWLKWRQSPGFTADSGDQLQWAEMPQAWASRELVWPNETCLREMRAFVDAPEWPTGFQAGTPERVLVNTEIMPDGRLLIHLRDQAGTERPICDCTVHLAAELSAGRTITMYAPDQAPTQLLTDADGPAKLTLPAFQRYALLVVEQGS